MIYKFVVPACLSVIRNSYFSKKNKKNLDIELKILYYIFRTNDSKEVRSMGSSNMKDSRIKKGLSMKELSFKTWDKDNTRSGNGHSVPD